MLALTIFTLFITSNVISRIQAEEQEDRKSQFSETQTSVYTNKRIIEALKLQKRDTLNIVPESYVEQTNHVGESQSSIRQRRDLDHFMSDLSKMWSSSNMDSTKTGGEISYGSQVYQKNNVYAADDRNGAVYGVDDVNVGNTYSGNSNGTNAYGPILVQENNIYRGKNNNAQHGASVTQIGNRYPEHPGKNDIYTGVIVQTGNTYSENPENETVSAIIINQSNNTYPKSIENNKDALKPIIHQSGNFYPSSNDSEARMNTTNNTTTQINSAEWNATDNHGNSSSTNYNSSSHNENKTLSNEKRKTYASTTVANEDATEKAASADQATSCTISIVISIFDIILLVIIFTLYKMYCVPRKATQEKDSADQTFITVDKFMTTENKT